MNKRLRIGPSWVLLALVLLAWRYGIVPTASASGPGYLLFPAGYIFTDNNGNPCSGCKVSSFLASTTTPTPTYSDQALTVANPNPIVLNSAGRNPAGGTYGADASTVAFKFILKSAADAVIWTQDQVSIPATTAPPAPAAVPTGTVFPYAAAAAPSGYLLCDGSAVSRTTFSGLFAVIATVYGVGDGSTTFNLPDMRGRYAFGKATAGTGSALGAIFGTIDHTHTSAAHTHSVAAHTHTFTSGVPSATTSGVQSGSGVTVGTSTHTHSGTSDSTALTTDSTTPGATGTANAPSVTFVFIVKTSYRPPVRRIAQLKAA